MRLVETVNRNMRLTAYKQPLVERYAHIPDLDAREAKAFAEFSRQQGAACLEAIEDWLEARRKSGGSKRLAPHDSLSAGMHVFAYIGKPARARKGSSSPRRTTSSRAIRA
jgi:hypothetical protein